MAKEFHDLEDSLKKFLVDEQTDNYNTSQANVHKYNNLKLSMDPVKEPRPHLFVRIGISEAYFDIADGKILNGGLGSDTRFVRRWIARNLQRGIFKEMWADAHKVETIDLKLID